MFVMDNRQANRDWEGSLDKLKAMMTKHGVEIVRCLKWGERKLAYEMDGRRRGTYILAYFNGTGQAVNAIYRECELSDMMLRALILKIEKMPSEEEMRSPDEVAPAQAKAEAPEPAAPAEGAPETKSKAEAGE
jgi:small subunit ribosomal protein S6